MVKIEISNYYSFVGILCATIFKFSRAILWQEAR